MNTLTPIYSLSHLCSPACIPHFFFTAPPPPDTSTLSLHDALPICPATRIAHTGIRATVNGCGIQQVNSLSRVAMLQLDQRADHRNINELRHRVVGTTATNIVGQAERLSFLA